jgi:hypothetical protein
MDDSTFRPQFYRAEWRGERKFGQYEFSKFPSADIAFVGSKSIGKVEVNCRFRFDESKWGVLRSGDKIRAAGIIRMDLHSIKLRGISFRGQVSK